MSHILKIFKDIISKRCVCVILSIACLLCISIANAQFVTPRTTWDGPFDIKMIGSANQIPVYYNVTRASSDELYIDSIVRQETYQRSGGQMNINNNFSSGFNTISMPKTAFMCNQDPDVGICTSGLPTSAPSTACPVKFNSSPLTQNVPLILTYADYDNDNSTFSSSMAELSIPSCSEIEAAYLYWTGGFKTGSNTLKLVDSPWNSFTVGVPNSTVFNNATFAAGTFDDIKIKIPGSSTYTAITADQVITASTDDRFVCFKNITTLVNTGAGSGQYWVADIPSWPTDNRASSGWGLVIVYTSPSSPPRRISIFDGYTAVPNTSTAGLTVTLTGLQVPSSTNFKSYIGFGALDAEDVAAEFPTPGTAPPAMSFTTGSTTTSINQFVTRKYRYYGNTGFPTNCSGSALKDACNAPLDASLACEVYDGVASSRISTYDEVADENGAEITRLPALTNTYGIDLHHIKLPDGAVEAGATQASINLKSSFSGGYNLFMTYIAIERLQPKLVMTKTAPATTTPGSSLTYTLRVTNIGNTASLGARIYDTLDIATNYTTLVSSTRYNSSGTSLGSGGVTLLSSASDNLQFQMPSGTPLGINEYVDIVFTVGVVPYAGNTNLYDVQCKRTIENTAWVRYKISASSTDSLTAKSNSDDCGIGTETRVLITGFTTSPIAVSADACTHMTQTVVDAIKEVLDAQSGITTAMLSEFDIRDVNNVRVESTDLMSDVTSADQPFKAYRDLSSGACQQIYHITFTGCILPVEIISFTGWRNDEVNTLRWVTSSEKDNSYFIVERSSDGTEFVAIGTVQGHGNSSEKHTYRFDDVQPLSGTTYYRLKQVDFNGSFSYTNTIAIDNSKRSDISIYPNPNNGSFTISILASEQSYKLDIIDVEGRSVYVASGSSVPENIEVSSLAKGLYIVRFYIDNDVIIKKMVVY